MAYTMPPSTGPLDRDALRQRAMRRNLVQIAIVAVVVAMIAGVGYAIQASLAARGVAFSFGYLGNPAGFEISEGFTFSLGDPFGLVAFTSGMTNAQALVTGFVNTIKVAVLAIILATVFGTILGIGRLSTNWLVRQLCFWFVEFVRNTPLLIQLTFWYVAVVLQFPGLASAPRLLGAVFSQQGIWLPGLALRDDAGGLPVILCLVALCAAAYAMFAATRSRRVAGWSLTGVAVIAIAAAGFPFTTDVPEVGRFRASGGWELTPEFTAILIAITVNSCAYIGEVVRGAIENLHKGQWEAAGSLGFSRSQTIRDIVLPQVFRVVLPSLGNQYIGLAKNTSLGIAIGFPDLFNIYGTVANQTGRSLEGVIIVMLTYLLISLSISALVNVLNARTRIPGART